MDNLTKFQFILRMSQRELKSYLETALQEMGYPTVSKRGYLYAEGEIPVLLVAHLDTVHKAKPDIICISEDGRYMMSPQGIGGDDRCGVFMILQIIEIYEAKLGFYSCTVPTFMQYVLTELIDNGDFERHINRVRRTMRKKLSITI